jgi:hypothetical protein
MRIVISFFLTFFIVTSLESQDLETFFDSLDKKLSIGLIGVEEGQYGRYKVSRTKRQLVEINRLKIERAITESLKSKNVTLKSIVYNNTLCFPSDNMENREAIDDFYRKKNLRLLKKLAKVNKVVMIVYVQTVRRDFKRYITKKKNAYRIRISLYIDAFKSSYSWRTFNIISIHDGMTQNTITSLVSQALTNNLRTTIPSLEEKRQEIEINDASAW